MYSVNVPVPGRVRRIAADLEPTLQRFDRVRDRHTLVVKRVGDDPPDRLATRVRDALRGVGPFRCRVTGIDAFEDPPVGTAPVVYLAVSGPLAAVHDRLCRVEPPVAGIEGREYTPHVTLARGGDPGSIDDLRAASVSAEWSVSELLLWDAEYREPTARIGLPV